MSVEDQILSMVRVNDTALVAGIVECRQVLALVERGLVTIVSGSITPEGGSGLITKGPEFING